MTARIRRGLVLATEDARDRGEQEERESGVEVGRVVGRVRSRLARVRRTQLPARPLGLYDDGRDLPDPAHLRVGAQTAINGATYTVAFNQPVSLAAATSASGAAGGVVSMVTGTLVAGLVLPAGSVAVICSALVPCGKAVDVMDQGPAASTTTVPSTVTPLGA